ASARILPADQPRKNRVAKNPYSQNFRTSKIFCLPHVKGAAFGPDPRTTSRTARGAAIRGAGPFAVKAARVGSRVTRRFRDFALICLQFSGKTVNNNYPAALQLHSPKR